MKYISKGIVVKTSTEVILHVTRCGCDFQLTGVQADIWLKGRFGFFTVKEDILEQRALQQLVRQELVEIADRGDALGEYRALTQCVPVPVRTKDIVSGLSFKEKEMLHWLTAAGLQLTMAELVCLNENNISPTSEFLGSENRQVLTEIIYTQENIQDNLLETQMEYAKTREAVTGTVLSLLKKQRIILL